MTTQQHTEFTAAGAAAADSRLRFWLRIDAVASGLSGFGSLAGLGFLPDLLGTPPALLVPVGIFLLVWAGALWFLASRPQVSRGAVWAVIALNLVWVLDSAATVAIGWFPLTGLGVAYLLAQAAAVALFAEMQYLGVRRLPR